LKKKKSFKINIQHFKINIILCGFFFSKDYLYYHHHHHLNFLNTLKSTDLENWSLKIGKKKEIIFLVNFVKLGKNHKLNRSLKIQIEIRNMMIRINSVGIKIRIFLRTYVRTYVLNRACTVQSAARFRASPQSTGFDTVRLSAKPTVARRRLRFLAL